MAGGDGGKVGSSGLGEWYRHQLHVHIYLEDGVYYIRARPGVSDRDR